MVHQSNGASAQRQVVAAKVETEVGACPCGCSAQIEKKKKKKSILETGEMMIIFLIYIFTSFIEIRV